MRGIGPSLPTNWPIPLIRYIPRINSNGQLCASNSVHQTATVPNVRDAARPASGSVMAAASPMPTIVWPSIAATPDG